MSIYVSIEVGKDPKSRGDLLEKLAKKLLEVQNYEVETEVRKTGEELDLLCQHKTNPSKKIFVECKAYNSNKVQADTITQLCGKLHIKGYREGWLISASDLGKEAKGLLDDIKNGPDADKFTFYTPKALLEALSDASIIVKKELAIARIADLKVDRKRIGDANMLFSTFGDFWCIEYLKGGVVDGIIFANANDGEIVLDDSMIANLEKLDFRYKGYDLGVIYKLLDPNDKTLEGHKLQNAALDQEYVNMQKSELGMASAYNQEHSVEDLFVYPDIEIREFTNTKEKSKIVSSSILSDKKSEAWLIFGDDLSGKTTLCFILQWALASTGYIALKIQAKDVKSVSAQKVRTAIKKAFIEQYDVKSIPRSTIESYLNEKYSDMAIIIDDFDNISFKGSKEDGLSSLAAHLKDTFGKVIIIANSSKELEFTTSNRGQETFAGYSKGKIVQLGHLRRDEVVEKWLILNNPDALGKAEMLAKKEDFANRINVAIGTNYLPTYPFYTLAMIQMLEDGSKAKLQGSEYAALYGHLVNHALISNRVDVSELGFYNTYLSHLASNLFTKRTNTINVQDINTFFKTYLLEMGLSRQFDSVHQKLLDSKILKVAAGEYFFNLPYFRYYFFAKYLSDNLEDASTKGIIGELVNNLQDDESANIVVFLVHHSKSSTIIDTVINKAMSQFNSILPQTLAKDEVETINKLITGEMKLTLRNVSATEQRKKILKRRDSFERNNLGKTQKNKEDLLDIYGQITAAFRTIDVLGKITGNYFGELNANRKESIMKELYGLGFRSLHVFLDSFESYIDGLRSHIESTIDDREITTGTSKSIVANRIIYNFTHLIAYAFIKRVSDSVTSQDLSVIIDSVLGKESAPTAKLTTIATKLNFSGGLENSKTVIISLYDEFAGNSLARDLLRILTVEHMYRFEVGYKERQSVCHQLNIDFVEMQRKRLRST